MGRCGKRPDCGWTQAALPTGAAERGTVSALIALSLIIDGGRRIYYEMLELSNKDNEITAWLEYFAQTVRDAQAHAQEIVEFPPAMAHSGFICKSRSNSRPAKIAVAMWHGGTIPWEAESAPRATALRTWMKRLGFVEVRQTGSHLILRRDQRTVVVPMHRPIKPGTLNGLIERRASLWRPLPRRSEDHPTTLRGESKEFSTDRRVAVAE
jgi:predicted RNA binding protein YcfA (HicA-like mRNA interferase family)